MTHPDEEIEVRSWLSLSMMAGLPAKATRALLRQYGSPMHLLQHRREIADQHGGVVAEALLRRPDASKVDAALDWLGMSGCHLVTLADDDYPKGLLETQDPPLLMYLKGDRKHLRRLGRLGIAIVGSRNATPGGMQNARQFSSAIASNGIPVISGLALGIDSAAHAGALEAGGLTVAVVGTGLDTVYPSRNAGLASEITKHGLMLSEYPLGTPPLRENFPRRNRIISGLSGGVLVVEAAIGSGSLITAREAAEQGRDVFAIPGSIHSSVSKGCHLLIKQGAKLVENAEDVIGELALTPETSSESATTFAVSEAAEIVLHGLGYDPVAVDALIERIPLTAAQISAHMTELELAGVVTSLPGGRYQRRV